MTIGSGTGLGLLAPVARPLGRAGAVLRRLVDQEGQTNRSFVAVLGLAVGLACVLDIPELRLFFPTGIDLEIPLRAASNWAAGSQPYPPAAMLVHSGPNLPFLYPPYLLPFLAPIAALPRDLVTGMWLILCVLCAVWTCRRLAIPWPAIPFLLAWPPFAEGLITGNIQILTFAVFAGVFYGPVAGVLRQRSLAGHDTGNGVGAVAVGALKVTQMLPVLYLARRRFRAAAVGVAALAVVVIATLPITGIAVYGDWLAQLQRAADPGWTVGGVAIGRQIGIPDEVFGALGIAIAFGARGRDSAAWLGIALVVATPSVHGYTFLFLLPALLAIRHDVAICVAALFIGVYHAESWWLATGLVIGLMVLMNRWQWLRSVQHRQEPVEGRRSAA